MKVNDVIKEAEYTDIILSLLAEPYQIVSMTKIIFFLFAYIMKIIGMCIKIEEKILLIFSLKIFH